MTSVEFGSGHRKLHPLWEVLLSPGWCLLTVTVALGCGGGDAEGKVFCLFSFFFMFGFEILLFSKPYLPTATLGIGLAGVFPSAGEKQVHGEVSSGGVGTTSFCWQLLESL